MRRVESTQRRLGPALIPQTLEDLDEPATQRDRAFAVAGARVAYLDLVALETDFPEVADGAGRGEAARREHWSRWLLERAALISEAQARQTLVNSPIETRGPAREVYRLPRGGRAFCAPVQAPGLSEGAPEAGLLALKGVGVGPGQAPADGGYRNGLLRLDAALGEVLSQKLIEAILDHLGDDFQTLPVYGIVDLGFDLRSGGESLGPAAVLVRRAHLRPVKGWDFPRFGSRAHLAGIDLELALRRYGVSSTSVEGAFILKPAADGEIHLFYWDFGELVQGPCPRSMVDNLWQRYSPFADDDGAVRFVGINLQMTREQEGHPLQLLDFGGIRIARRFSAPLISRVHDRESNWGGVVAPDSPHFVQPQADLALPAEFYEEHPLTFWQDQDLATIFGTPTPDDLASIADRPMEMWDLLGRWLARRVRRRQISAAAVGEHLEAYVEAALARPSHRISRREAVGC